MHIIVSQIVFELASIYKELRTLCFFFYFQVFYTEILWQQEVDSFSRRYVHVHDDKT